MRYEKIYVSVPVEIYYEPGRRKACIDKLMQIIHVTRGPLVRSEFDMKIGKPVRRGQKGKSNAKS